MSELVKCPFCDNLVEVDADKCPKCGSWFKEPDLKEIKFTSFSLFCVLQILTVGLFASVWFFVNNSAIRRLIVNPKDAKKFSFLLVLLLLSFGLYLTGNFYIAVTAPVVQYLIHLALIYRVLRTVQKYTLSKYDVEIDFNPYYVFFFGVFYLVHFLDTYTDRVINSHDYFNFKSPQGFILIILLILIAIFINVCNGVFLQIKGF